MTLDLGHAILSAVLILAVVVGMQKAGLYVPHKEGGPRWSWPLLAGIFGVLFVFNLIWP